jgi:hypothetical protein
MGISPCVRSGSTTAFADLLLGILAAVLVSAAEGRPLNGFEVISGWVLGVD